MTFGSVERPDQWADGISFYLNCIRDVDRHVGVVLDALEASGQAESKGEGDHAAELGLMAFSSGIALAGIAVPNFVVAPVLALVFGVRLGWLPVAGWEPGSLRYALLPAPQLTLKRVVIGKYEDVKADNILVVGEDGRGLARLADFGLAAAAGRAPVFVGIGGNATAKAVHDLKRFESYAFDGIVSVCPYYNRPGQDGLFDHFSRIAAGDPQVEWRTPSREPRQPLGGTPLQARQVHGRERAEALARILHGAGVRAPRVVGQDEGRPLLPQPPVRP